MKSRFQSLLSNGSNVYRYATAQPFKPMVLSGAATAEQLESNAAALRLLERLRESDGAGDALARLLEVGRVAPDDYWSERSALAWN